MQNITEIITVDSSRLDGTAVQIHEGIAEAVRSGQLVTGTRLPSVRTLAVHWGISPNTVAKAIKSLEAAGIVSTHGRNGTRIESAHRAMGQAQGAARALAEHARAAGLDAATTHQLLDAALATLEMR